MPRIEIDVDQILTSAVSIEIDPGDKVLVMSGVIIGVVGKNAIKQPPRETAPALDVPAPRQKGNQGPPRLPENLVLEKNALELIRQKGPITGRALASSLGSAANKNGRVSSVLKRLKAEGLIRPTEDNVRYPAYVFTGNGVAAY